MNKKKKIDIVIKKELKLQSPGHCIYHEAIQKNKVVFCTGSAGTGKTTIAAHAGIDALSKNNIQRLIFTRPAVEAGEKLGYIPGRVKEKFDPFIRPIYECIQSIIGQKTAAGLIDEGNIEAVPLAYTRGLTFSNCFVILDEAQNASVKQLKMLLTRMGRRCKIIINGDCNQSDISKSRLYDVAKTLCHIKGITHVEMTQQDNMRDPLINDILNALSYIE